MVVITYGDIEVEVEGARWRDGDVWVPIEGLPSAVGWDVRPEGVCAGETCVPLPPGATWWDDEFFNLSAFARHIGLAEASDSERAVVAFVVPGEGSPRPGSVDAPDFTLPDLDGNLHSLSDHRGEKVVLFTWGSFCGCRFDLPGWQALYDELKSDGFTVIAVAEDAGGAATAGPWIRPSGMEEQYPPAILDLMGWDAAAWESAAPPEYPCLIDERHQLSLLYGMVNVPTAVWIDEEGRIVRPPEPAGVTEAFKAIDLASFSMPPDAVETGSRHRNRYFDAVRDWVRRGSDSPAALPPIRRSTSSGGRIPTRPRSTSPRRPGCGPRTGPTSARPASSPTPTPSVSSTPARSSGGRSRPGAKERSTRRSISRRSSERHRRPPAGRRGPGPGDGRRRSRRRHPPPPPVRGSRPGRGRPARR